MPERGPIRILYMEDDPGLGRLVQKRLEHVGYATDVALNGEEGLARYKAGAYDVVIVDQEMPIYSGLKVIQIMASKRELPPTIMLTGSGSEETAVEAMKLGAGDYIVKDMAGGYLDLLPPVVERVLSQHRLVEAKQRAEEALKESEARFRAVAQTAVDAIVSADSAGNIVFWNSGAKAMFGYDEEEVLGKPFSQLILDQAAGDSRRAKKAIGLTGEPCRERRIELMGLKKNGDEFPVELSLTSWEAKSGTFYTAIIRDISDRVEYEAKLARMALHDSLTGVYNRHYFNERIKEEIDRSRRYNHSIGFIMLDVDRFKEINDRFGHLQGDRVLKEVAKVLEKEVRETDIVIRYGGDEFLIVLPETNGEADTVIGRIRQALARQNEEEPIIEFPVTLGVGISHWRPGREKPLEEVLAEADRRMYQDKATRRKNIRREKVAHSAQRSG